jgi:hypothetical protein
MRMWIMGKEEGVIETERRWFTRCSRFASHIGLKP